jgi:hypothetical protein
MSIKNAKIMDTQFQSCPGMSSICPQMSNCKQRLSYNVQHTRMWAIVTAVLQDTQMGAL